MPFVIMVQNHKDVILINRKIIYSVRKNIELLKSGSFDEHNVKDLLIDLREIARKHDTKENNKFQEQIKDFVDICDFIPHPNRDRGTIGKNIREYVNTLHEIMQSSTTNGTSQLAPNVNAINADKIVNAMLAFAYVVLYCGDKSITREYISDVFKYKDDIALCLLSLLQDSTIDLDDEGAALLFILPFERKYRLYCQVLNSRIEREARERTKGTGMLILSFPVMLSSAPCIDNIPSKPPQGPPNVFETFRDVENKLRMRAIQ